MIYEDSVTGENPSSAVDLSLFEKNCRIAEDMHDNVPLPVDAAAEFLRASGYPVSPKTLSNWRVTRSDGPAFRKFGGRVIYRVGDLREFIRRAAVNAA